MGCHWDIKYSCCRMLQEKKGDDVIRFGIYPPQWRDHERYWWLINGGFLEKSCRYLDGDR